MSATRRGRCYNALYTTRHAQLPYHPKEFAVRDRLDSPTTQDCALSLSGAPQSSSSAKSRAYHQQRLAQQRQQELERRIAHAQKSQVARASAYLLEVWHSELVRWKAVEQAADLALRGLG